MGSVGPLGLLLADAGDAMVLCRTGLGEPGGEDRGDEARDQNCPDSVHRGKVAAPARSQRWDLRFFLPFGFVPYFRAHRRAIFGLFANIHRRCFPDLNGMTSE
jgi:hypothetical protein